MEATTLAKKLLGKSYAETEDFALSVYRQYVLKMPDTDAKAITQNQLKLINTQVNSIDNDSMIGGDE